MPTFNPRPPAPNSAVVATVGKDSFVRAISTGARRAWQRAFGSDGVHSRYAAEAVAIALQTASDWIHDQQATGDIASNPNAAFQLFTLDENNLPDGWEVVDSSVLPFVSKITDGEYGPNALRLNNTTSGALTFTLRSPLVPIHPDWIYAYEAFVRNSNVSTGAGSSVARFFDRDEVFISDVVTSQLSSPSHADNVWTTMQLDGTSPTVRANQFAGPGPTARFGQIQISVTAGAGETADMDFGRMHRVADLAQIFPNANLTGVFTAVSTVDLLGQTIDRSNSLDIAAQAVFTSVASATSKWTAPYDMAVKLGCSISYSGGPTRVVVGFNLNDSGTGYNVMRVDNDPRKVASSEIVLQVVKGDFLKFQTQRVGGGGTETIANGPEETRWTIEELPTW